MLPLLWSLLLAPALAGEDAESEEGDWVPLDPPEDPGSALDEGAVQAPPRAHLRGRWLVRPQLGLVGLEGESLGSSATLGGVVGRQWWVLDEWVVRPVSEVRLRGRFPVRGRGQDLCLSAALGAWGGPVGLLAGPSLRWDRLALRSGAEVEGAWTVGAQLRLAGKLGPVIPWVSATPAWIARGREPAALPLGDELELGAGVELDLRPVGLRLSGARRLLAEGTSWEASLSVQARLL